MKAVLTTGANSGIGLATVLEVAKLGFRSIGSVRSEAKADAVAKVAADAGLEVETVLLDVTDEEACTRVLSDLSLYGLVNNAGYGLTGAVEDVSDDEARAALETMVLAPMRLARLALPHMRGRREGRIVNVSSIMGRTATPLTGWYQAAKHGLEAVTDALRVEVAGAGVRVSLVEPGGFKTSIWDDLERDVERRGASQFGGSYLRLKQVMRLGEPVMGEPSRVAKIIGRALTSPRPRSRYLVGIDAQAAALSDSLTPDPVKDFVFRRVLGL
jgi:NAD(P)-dependent dehydrogenase (short-subunit alcohol dehydrogenase family)